VYRRDHRLSALWSFSCALAVLIAVAAPAVAVTGVEKKQFAPESALISAACPATVNIPGKKLRRVFPTLRSGDRDFAGNGPAITVSAKRQQHRTFFEDGSPFVDSLDVVVRMKARETEPDSTAARGLRAFSLYRAPAGCTIASVDFGNFDSNGYLARPPGGRAVRLSAGDIDPINKSFVRRYTVFDDRAGNDVGSYTSVRVFTRPFSVQLTG
jgi:hypothetical protein